MKKLLLVVLGGMGFLFFSGCGGSSSTSTTSSSSTSTVTVTGSLKTTAKAKDYTGYSIFAKEKGSYKIYTGTVNADGSFTLDVLENKSYIITILDSKSHVEAVLVPTAPSSSATSITTGIKATSQGTKLSSSTLSLGAFTYDAAKWLYTPQSDLSSLADTTVVARATNGKPVGMGNLGKGSEAKLPAKLSGSSDDDGDEDDDGLVDEEDADGDGDGEVDELEVGDYATTKAGRASTCIKNVGVFMNLKLPYDKSNSFDTTTDMVITIELVPDSSCVSSIQTIDLDTGPSSYKNDATIQPMAGGWTDLGDPESYPSSGDLLWKNHSWALYKATSSEGDTRWTVWIVPNGTVEAGDTFQFKVKYSDSSTEHFVKAISYVFTDIPDMTFYQGSSDSSESTAPTPSTGGEGTSGSPISFTGDDLTVKWERPTDESGSDICSMSYVFEVFYIVGGVQEESKRCTTTVSDDSACSTSMQATLTKADCLSSTTPTLGSSVESYQVDITASSSAGDNAAQLVYFSRSTTARAESEMLSNDFWLAQNEALLSLVHGIGILKKGRSFFSFL